MAQQPTFRLARPVRMARTGTVTTFRPPGTPIGVRSLAQQNGGDEGDSTMVYVGVALVAAAAAAWWFLRK